MWATTTGGGGLRVRIAEITSEIEFDIGALCTKNERPPRTIVQDSRIINFYLLYAKEKSKRADLRIDVRYSIL